jgi:hypothetical protein
VPAWLSYVWVLGADLTSSDVINGKVSGALEMEEAENQIEEYSRAGSDRE